MQPLLPSFETSFMHCTGSRATVNVRAYRGLACIYMVVALSTWQKAVLYVNHKIDMKMRSVLLADGVEGLAMDRLP